MERTGDGWNDSGKACCWVCDDAVVDDTTGLAVLCDVIAELAVASTDGVVVVVVVVVIVDEANSETDDDGFVRRVRKA